MANTHAHLEPAAATIIERLDRLIAVFQIAHSRELAAARSRIREDEANAAILEATEAGWVPAGVLRDKIVNKTGLKSSAVRARIGELSSMGALERRGGGPTTEYRSAGIV